MKTSPKEDIREKIKQIIFENLRITDGLIYEEKMIDSILESIVEVVESKKKKLDHEKYSGYKRHIPECRGCAQEDVLDDLLSILKGGNNK